MGNKWISIKRLRESVRGKHEGKRANKFRNALGLRISYSGQIVDFPRTTIFRLFIFNNPDK